MKILLSQNLPIELVAHKAKEFIQKWGEDNFFKDPYLYVWVKQAEDDFTIRMWAVCGLMPREVPVGEITVEPRRMEIVPNAESFHLFDQRIPQLLESITNYFNTNRTESGHYAYPREKRRKIVIEYRKARQHGDIPEKGAWARNYYHISDRTLSNYEKEFPQSEM